MAAAGNDDVHGAAADMCTSAIDVELPRPAQQEMQAEAQHQAAYMPSDAGKPCKPQSSDKVYSKVLCLTCGFGEVLGNTICGEYVQCFCFECFASCGLGGNDGCPEWVSACGLFKPKAMFGASMKFLCCKVGCVSPAEKPFVVLNQRTVA
mmetsp:Transcript_33444/g.106003  ORF Transcript_33444/g.106003 Transcript_33444/m.106003 type:complete len:150 (-) Transcript_33444:64-513(-)